MSKTSEATASIIPAVDALPVPESTSAEGTWLQRLGKRLFLRSLAKFHHGELTVVVPATGERHVFGRRTPECDLHATLEVLHPQTFADAAFGGTVGGGEAYIRGLWRTDDLTALVRMFVANREAMESFEGAAAYVSRSGAARAALVQPQQRRRQPPQHRRPLRSRQRPVRAVPRRDDDVFVRRVRTRGREPARSPARQARPHLSPAPACRPATTSSRSAPAGVAWRCTRRRNTAAGSRPRPSRASSTTGRSRSSQRPACCRAAR